MRLLWTTWIGRFLGFTLGSLCSPTLYLWPHIVKPYFDMEKALTGLMPTLVQVQHFVHLTQHQPELVLFSMVPQLMALLVLGLGYMVFVSWLGGFIGDRLSTLTSR